MVIVRLRGGFGNQLFQYATGVSLANTLGVELKIDTYTYQQDTHGDFTKRKLELGKFNINFTEATRKEIKNFTGKNIFSRFFHKKTNYRFNSKVYSQPKYAFSESFLKLSEPIYISGYWQSERFFEKHKSQIKELYTPSQPINNINNSFVNDMQKSNSVSIHIRKGDYEKNPNYSGFFGVLEKSYYLKAIKHIESKTEHPVYYFFSDSPEWCKKEFGHLKNANFIDHNSGSDSYWDLILMTKCKHNIIANSSFSWWGAWLNDHVNKIVIAPKKWFNQTKYTGKDPSYHSRYYDTKDLIPSSWVRL